MFVKRTVNTGAIYRGVIA